MAESTNKRKVAMSVEERKKLVGSMIEVWCPTDKKFYKAFIESYNHGRDQHKVAYVHGDVEMLNLNEQKWNFVNAFSSSSSSSEMHPPPPPPPPQKKTKGIVELDSEDDDNDDDDSSASESESLERTQTPPPEQQVVRYVNITKTLNLRVDSFENMDDVKDKFSEFEGIETKVFFTKNGFENGQELDFDRKDGSSVHLNLHLGVRLQVNVKVSWGATTTTTDDKLISLDVLSWDTISDVKAKFQDKEGTPANQLTLFYNGKQLDDSQTLAGYDIVNHSTLDVFSLGEDRMPPLPPPPPPPLQKKTKGMHFEDDNDDPLLWFLRFASKSESLERTQTPPEQVVRYVNITKTLNLRVDSFENMDDVKDKFSEFEGIETKVLFTQNGFVNGQELDFGRKDGSRVHLNLHLGVRLQVNVKVSWGATTTTDDKLISLDVLSWDTISGVKAKFQDKEGTPANQLTLFYNGKQLDDSQTLAGYGIENHSTLDAFSLGEDKIVISVRILSNDSIKVMVKLCSTVVTLKRMIRCMGLFAVDRQKLTFNGVLLENCQRMVDYQIQMGSVLNLDLISITNGMKIFVRMLNGKQRTIYVDSSDTVGTLKTEIKYFEGVPEELQRLLFAGKILEDGRTLGDYDIYKECSIHVLPRRVVVG